MHDNTTGTRPATDTGVQYSFFDAVNTSLFEQAAPDAAEFPFDVHCDICKESSFGTSVVLEARGWGLYGDFEFCPYHEDMT